MKTKIIFSLLCVFTLAACTKQEDSTPTPSNQLRVVDITPNTYTFVKGRWDYCDPQYADARKGEYIIFTDSVMTWVKPMAAHPQNLITGKYFLVRDQNINMIVFHPTDTTIDLNSAVFEIREDNSFYINSYRYCR